MYLSKEGVRKNFSSTHHHVVNHFRIDSEMTTRKCNKSYNEKIYLGFYVYTVTRVQSNRDPIQRP